jgi:DNA-binding transcriptional ArsR family regulator
VVNKQKRITVIFAALADPTRRRIIERLSRSGESPVTALAQPFQISLPAFSRHLRVLESARLIRRRRNGRLHLIRVQRSGLREAHRWIAHYVAGWEFSFDALEVLLEHEKQ